MFEVRLLNKDMVHRLGCDYTIFMKDLKTLKGVIKRVNNINLPMDVLYAQVYEYPEKDRYIYDVKKSLVNLLYFNKPNIYHLMNM